MLIAVGRDAFANDVQAIVNALGDSQHFEVARGKIAKQIEIVHLPIDKEKGVFGFVAETR